MTARTQDADALGHEARGAIEDALEFALNGRITDVVWTLGVERGPGRKGFRRADGPGPPTLFGNHCCGWTRFPGTRDDPCRSAARVSPLTGGTRQVGREAPRRAGARPAMGRPSPGAGSLPVRARHPVADSARVEDVRRVRFGVGQTFAVIAFETLALVNPLLGDEVQSGEPELEEQALEGLFPWVDAEDDDRNRSSDGIPRDIALSARLRENFGRAFGPGQSKPEARPGIARWADRLHAAANRTVTCSECSGRFYCDRDRCSWCGAPRPSFVMARVLLWDPKRRHAGEGVAFEAAPGILHGPSGKPQIVDRLAISGNEPVDLTERITHGATGYVLDTMNTPERSETVQRARQGSPAAKRRARGDHIQRKQQR